MNEINESTLEMLARDAQRVGAVVDHDLPEPADAPEQEQALLDALELGVEPIGKGA